MIDPRSMPCARVRLPRLSARELPPNAQEQYHNYTLQRKRSMTSISAGNDSTDISSSSPSPVDFTFVSGVLRDQVDTSTTNNGTMDSTQSSSSSLSCLPIVSEFSDAKTVKINTLSTKRRNSVASTSSRQSSASSKSTGLIASVCLTPVTWKTPGYATRPYEHHVPEIELDCASSEVLSDLTDDSRLSEIENRKDVSYYTRRELVPQDYEEVPSTSGLSPAVAAPEQDMEESSYSSGFSSLSEHVMYSSCEDTMWPDLQSYSPPESPDPQKTETLDLKEFSEESQPTNSYTASGISSHSADAKHFLAGQNQLLSPEVKLVPLDRNHFKHNERKTIHASESARQRKLSSTKGGLLVEIEDVREKLVPLDGKCYNHNERKTMQDRSESARKRKLSSTKDLLVEIEDVREELVPLDGKCYKHNERKAMDGSESARKRKLSPTKNLLVEIEDVGEKLVSPDGKCYRHNETMHGSESVCKRKLSPTKDLLIKIEDVGEKLKPCASGGLTVVTNSARGRFTSSGRRIAQSYSEKSLQKLSLTRALKAQRVKKRKVRSTTVPQDGAAASVSGVQHPGKKRKRGRPNKNPAGRKKNALERYENLKFSELNTVPRMATRYKVAFAKWPYVFSGALDLINQRISSQNTFWDSLKS